MTQPPCGSGLPNLQEGELRLVGEGNQLRAEARDPDGPLLRSNVEQARASASANNSPEPAQRAGGTEDAETQPPHIMGDQPTQPSQADIFAAMQAAHAVAEAGRVREAELREKLSAQEAATMQETIKRIWKPRRPLSRRRTRPSR